jgi:hypothetical protein
MDNISLLNTIKKEGINTLDIFSEGDDIYGAYICTLKSNEVEMGKHFVNQYEFKKIWNVTRTPTGYVENAWEYQIIDKYSGNIVFEQTKKSGF